jgi:hypothetical protein
MHPKARQTGFTVQEVAGELVIYDEKRHRVHNLNSTAARVWKLCDGTISEAEIARCLAEETNTPVDEALVRFTLAELGRARLLEALPTVAEDAPVVSRRQLMRQAAMAAGMALVLPVITSMVAPTPAQAQGGGTTGDPGGPKDECTGDYKLQKTVTISAKGKNCEEAQHNAMNAVFAFADQKCAKRKCRERLKCTSTKAIGQGRCKKDGNVAIWTYVVSGYSCGCG